MPSFRPELLVVVSCSLALACGDDIAPPAASGGTTDAEPTTAVDGSAGGSGDAGSEDTGFEPPQAMCGNGFVEEGEECDDGNAQDGDGCSPACEVPCGLEWSSLVSGPTLDSEIEGRSVAVDGEDHVVVSGRLREITIEMDGAVIEGDDTVLVQSYALGGGMVWEQRIDSPDGDARPAGVAVDAAGDVYVAATLDAADGGTSIRAVKLAAGDGAVRWTHDFDGPLPGTDEVAADIEVGPDGRPVLSGQVRVADGDDDVWVRKLEPEDGAEAWTTTYGGVGSGMFSLDDGGPVAIAEDGSIFVLAGIYEDFETLRGVLLRFGADGGAPTWTFSPTISGADQTFGAVALEVGADGGPAMVVARAGTSVQTWLYRLDAAGAERWSRTHEDFEDPQFGTDWRIEGLAFHGEELVVLGHYIDDQQMPGASWWESWVARLGPEAAPRCRILQGPTSDELIPPSLFGYSVSASTAGSAVVAGAQISAEEQQELWLGSFRRQ